MAVSQIETSPGAAGAPGERAAPPPVLHAAELLAGVTLLVVALLGWAGLALAHAGRWSLPATLGLAGTGLALAALAAWRAAGRPRLVLDPQGLAMAAGLAVLAALLCFPGFPYGVGDKDPGGYISQAILIERTGSYAIDDPVLDKARIPAVALSSPGARLPGQWIEAGPRPRRTIPQFYHLWSAALAAAFALGGHTGLVNLNPLCGVLAVVVLGLAVRRVFGLLAGALAGVLLATCMLEVWQAKYQTSEVYTQLLFVGALLGVAVAQRSGWRPAAGLAGLLVGLGFLARADGLLLVLIAVAALCVLVATGRFDARAAWFAGGLAVTLPHGLLQAYHFARLYTLSVRLPSEAKLAVAVAAPLALAVALRLAARPLGERVARLATERRVQLAIGLAVVAGCCGLLLVGFLRPLLFGPAYFRYNGRVIRSYDEQALRRLSWFLTLPGFALMVGGIALVALRRWAAVAWVVVLPGLLLFPLYAYQAQNSSRLMWWSRRFLPVVLPTVVVLVALALAVALAWSGRWRWPVRLAGAAATLFLLVVFLGQSLPLRAHHEFAGSFATTRRVARLAGGRQGVYLWQPQPWPFSPTALFASPVWLQAGEISALLPARPNPAYVRSFERGFPGQPVFLVTAGGGRPTGYDGIRLRLADRISEQFPVWQESDTQRPSAARTVPVDMAIWQVLGTRPAT
jgi:hypothetical protein